MAIESKVKKLLPIDWNSPNIPSIPSITLKIMEAINSEDVAPGEVADLIRQDPALTVKVLRAVNSAFYALNTEVTSVKHATVLLGTQEVLRIALASVLSERFFDVPDMVKDAAKRLWTHSVAVALLVQDFDTEGLVEPDLYTLGLLHDIGWLLILSQVPELYNALSEETDTPLEQLEEAFGVNHRMWGARLAEAWDLPEPFQIVALRHHDPLDEMDPPDYLLFVTLANHLAHKIGFTSLNCPIEPLDEWVIERMKLDEDTLKDMEDAAMEEKEGIQDFVSRLIQ